LKLRAGMMPSPREERPSRAELTAVVRTLEQRLDATALQPCSPQHAAAPGGSRVRASS
jgi:hypothetical protein